MQLDIELVSMCCGSFMPNTLGISLGAALQPYILLRNVPAFLLPPIDGHAPE